MTFAFTPSRVNAEVTLGTRVFRQVRTNFSSDFLTYWTFLLAVSAARYHRDLRDQELLAAQTQARLTEARLDALKAQLNPHFFFNTLNAISALALRGDHAAVVDTLTRLGNLVRISLDSKRPHQIALEQEVEFLDGYLEIVRLSIGERLTVEYRRHAGGPKGAGAQHDPATDRRECDSPRHCSTARRGPDHGRSIPRDRRAPHLRRR